MNTLLRDFKGREVRVIPVEVKTPVYIGILGDIDDAGNIMLTGVESAGEFNGTVVIHHDQIRHVWIMPPAEPAKEPTP